MSVRSLVTTLDDWGWPSDQSRVVRGDQVRIARLARLSLHVTRETAHGRLLSVLGCVVWSPGGCCCRHAIARQALLVAQYVVDL